MQGDYPYDERYPGEFQEQYDNQVASPSRGRQPVGQQQPQRTFSPTVKATAQTNYAQQ